MPSMQPRGCPTRVQAQDELWTKLEAQVESIKAGPDALGPLAEWVKGARPGVDVGMLAQDLLGKLFVRDFVATAETWAAAKTLVRAPRNSNPLLLTLWLVRGDVRRAKRLLASTVQDDLSAVNAIGIAVHNLVNSLRRMQLMYAERGTEDLLPETAAERCLQAPVSVFRQATEAGSFGGVAYRKNSLFVLNIGSAGRTEAGRGLIFMENTWSRCPAAGWIPAMLEGVWRRALREA